MKKNDRDRRVPLLTKTIRIMKVTSLCNLLAVCSISASTYAQSLKFSIHKQNSSISEVFKEIEKKSDFTFFFNDNQINVKQKVNVSANNASIEDVLAQVLQNTGYNYQIIDKQILIKVSDKEVMAVPAIAQSDKKITGTVLDATGMPVIGANVMVKGTTNGTITDMDGKFSLEADKGATLVVSYIGFLPVEIKVDAKNTLDILMKEDVQGLDEVVVVGYGTVKKRDLTGAVTSVNAEMITAVPTTTAADALQGRVPGVLVSTSDWSPGSTPSVMIRGKRSIKASNDPLYVVDGIPITGGMNEISPTDIESMEVLKDASATAIYGSRGANGVILITTKQGKEGKTQVDYNGYVGTQTIQNWYDLMNGAEYAEYTREAYRNWNNPNRYMSDVPNREEDMKVAMFNQDPYSLESVLMGYDENGNYDPSRVRSNNWMDEVSRTGILTDHQLSIRGGGKRTNFLTSVTYNKNEGVLKDEDFERYSIRLNLNHEINNYVKIGTQTQYSHSMFHRGNSRDHWRVTPLGSLYEEDGSLTEMVGSDPQMWNPLLNLQEGAIDRPKKVSRYLGSYFLEIKLPVEGLKFRSNVGLDSRTVQDYEFYSANTTIRQNGTSLAKNATEKYSMFTLENLLFYDKTFKDKHTLGITLLQSIQEDKKETNTMSVEDLPADALKYYDVGSALTINSIGSDYVKWNMASFMGRINYNYLGRYLLTVSARYDGSSRLADGHKWVLFPSAALAWRVSDEDFMKKLDWLDNLKLRAGFGKTGNSAVNPYQTKGGLSIVKYPFDNGATEMIGFAPSVMANKLLTWETTDQWNLGIDFGVLRGRLNGTIDLYLQNTHDLLLSRQLPVVSGFPEVLSNVGKTRNKGIEVSLSSVNINAKDFQWTTDLMLSANKEEIVELYNGKVDDVGSKWFIGHPIDVHYDYHKIGIWQDTPEDHAEMDKFNANGSSFTPGSIRIKDVNGDYKITDEDKEILGTTRPKLIASLVNTFNYKGFDLSVFMYASFGSMLSNDMSYLQQSGRNNNVKMDYWTPSNPTNAFPRPSKGFEMPPYSSSLNYEKTNYFRIRTMTLGYTLPKEITKKFLTEKLRLYFTAQNPFIVTNYSGIDPEGTRGFGSPSVSSWIFGVNLTL